jgi:hypothetical protein
MKVNNTIKILSNKKRKLQANDELQSKKSNHGQDLPIICSNKDDEPTIEEEPIACSSCFDELSIEKLPDDCVLNILLFTDSKWLLSVGSMVRFLRNFGRMLYFGISSVTPKQFE